MILLRPGPGQLGFGHFFIMARTIKRHLPRRRPSGDYEALCDLCGVMWYRSQMFKDAAGRLRCPDDAAGRDPVTLSRLNAEAAKLNRYPTRVRDGGNFDVIGPASTGSGNFTDGPASDDFLAPNRTTAADIAKGGPVDNDIVMYFGSVAATFNNVQIKAGESS